MSISSSHHDLFHQPSPAEKISFVRSLIEKGDLNADVAMALLKSIHSELAQPQGQDHSLYASYARLMASLQHEMPDVHRHVVTNWQAPQPLRVESDEAMSEEGLLEAETGGEAKRTETPEVKEVGHDKEFWETEGSESEAAEPEEPGEIEEKAEGEESEEAKGQIEEGEEEEPGKEEREDEEPDQEEEPEEKDQELEKEAEPEKEENETREEPLEESEAEESQQESDEQEAPDVYEEAVEESEKPEVEISRDVEETSGSEEGERMATEAAEAAAHMEHSEGEAEIVEEEPGEAEPPMEAVE